MPRLKSWSLQAHKQNRVNLAGWREQQIDSQDKTLSLGSSSPLVSVKNTLMTSGTVQRVVVSILNGSSKTSRPQRDASTQLVEHSANAKVRHTQRTHTGFKDLMHTSAMLFTAANDTLQWLRKEPQGWRLLVFSRCLHLTSTKAHMFGCKTDFCTHDARLDPVEFHVQMNKSLIRYCSCLSSMRQRSSPVGQDVTGVLMII